MPPDFITTIDSDDEVSSLGEPSRPVRGYKDVDLDSDFEFDFTGGGQAGLDPWGGDEVKATKNGVVPIDVDDIIARRTGRPIEAYRVRKGKRLWNEASGEADSADNSSPSADTDEGHKWEGMQSDDEAVIGGEQDIDMNGIDSENTNEAIGSDGGDDEENESAGSEGDDGSEGIPDAEEDEDGADASTNDESDMSIADAARKDAFFAKDPTVEPTAPSSFAAMNLSRPLLRALTSLSLAVPTPIQARAIPLALLGRDILGSAVTGSGKTAAFMVPILERLCYRERGRGGQACRVLILCPTRELAVQCEAVGKALCERGGLDIRFALLVGGLSLNAQAHTLRTLPDILIATPGRLIDHLTNTPSFTLSALDVLVIDEADRMLEAGFTDELEEIVKACPRSRQTMLFSATMTDSVDELVRLSLDKPIRVFVDPKRSTASSLTQEFVRIRSDDTRSPSLLALCKRTVQERCIVFFRSKALAHQMKVVFGLCGLKAAELHGNLTQEQRLNSLNDFKGERVDYLLATDLASRGLDIKGVEAVINYDMPGQLSQYTHRVGRTARAGRKGRSISLVGEADRKMLKAVIKQSQEDQIRHRIIPAEAVTAMSEQLSGLTEDIQEILQEEREEKMLRQADMEVKKGQNMVEHEAEIFSRPARTWFQSEKEKLVSKTAGKTAYVEGFPGAKAPDAKEKPIKRGKYDGLSRKVKRRKIALEADEKDMDSTAAAIRHAKKSGKPTKISEPMARPDTKKMKKKKAHEVKKAKGSAFDIESRSKKSNSHEGMRAKQVKVNLAKKGKGGGKGGGKNGKP